MERFEHAVDALIVCQKQLSGRATLIEALQEYETEESNKVLSEIEQEYADIEDAIDNLYAIRETCGSRDENPGEAWQLV